MEQEIIEWCERRIEENEDELKNGYYREIIEVMKKDVKIEEQQRFVGRKAYNK